MSQDKIDLANAETEKAQLSIALAKQLSLKVKQVLAKVKRNDVEVDRLLVENKDLAAYAKELIQQQDVLLKEINGHTAISTALLERVGREDDA